MSRQNLEARDIPFIDNHNQSLEQALRQVKTLLPDSCAHGGDGSYRKKDDGTPILNWDNYLGEARAVETQDDSKVFHVHEMGGEIRLHSGVNINLGKDASGIVGTLVQKF